MPGADDQFDVFPREMLLRRIDPGHNTCRYYRLSVEPDLFGGASLVREWGRLGARGQGAAEAHADEGQAIDALMRLAALKRRRGYKL